MIRINEATDLSYQERFRKATADEVVPLFKEFFENAGIPGYNKEKFDAFVDENYPNLYTECKKYTLSMDNPFFKYIKEYAKQNGNIDQLLKYDTYAFIHNLIANRHVSEKQLAFTCPENEQIRILLNPNLFNLSNSDKQYLIDIYNYVLDNKMNDYVNNAYVRAAFSDKDDDSNSEELNFKVNLDDLNKKIWLLKALFFSNAIQELSDDKIKNNDKTPVLAIRETQNKIKELQDKTALISSPFVSVDVIENQWKLLSQLVQESGRAANGQRQETDTDKDNKKESSRNGRNRANRFNDRDRAFIMSKRNDIKKSLETLLNNGNQISNATFKDIIDELSDLL